MAGRNYSLDSGVRGVARGAVFTGQSGRVGAAGSEERGGVGSWKDGGPALATRQAPLPTWSWGSIFRANSMQVIFLEGTSVGEVKNLPPLPMLESRPGPYNSGRQGKHTRPLAPASSTHRSSETVTQAWRVRLGLTQHLNRNNAFLEK